ncbi:response regulator transcription factor [Knoellia sp. S7-12]|uniref:response regulator transcription factor n=1 Tax=Knoellia sp. S7-12 TaxID=3126698 RepID=UPI0033693983
MNTSTDRPSTVRVAVVDDATAIRESMAALLPSLTFTGSFANVESMLFARPEADVVVLDLHLSNTGQPTVRQGVAAIRAVVEASYRVCVYSQEERRFVLAACLAAGAHGLVSKASPTARLEEALRDIAAGEVVIPPTVIGLVEVLVRRNSLTILSDRQRHVLSGRARGLTYAELSGQLYLSESTLRGYWAEVTRAASEHFQKVAAGDLERALGLGPGDLLDSWPDGPPARPASHPQRPTASGAMVAASTPTPPLTHLANAIGPAMTAPRTAAPMSARFICASRGVVGTRACPGSSTLPARRWRTEPTKSQTRGDQPAGGSQA